MSAMYDSSTALVSSRVAADAHLYADAETDAWRASTEELPGSRDDLLADLAELLLDVPWLASPSTRPSSPVTVAFSELAALPSASRAYDRGGGLLCEPWAAPPPRSEWNGAAL